MRLSRYFQFNQFPGFDSKVLKRNILMHIFDGTIFFFAMSLISVSTILPVFIQRIGGNAIAIGSVSVLWYLGMNLPQLLFIRFSHNKERVKSTVLWTGLLYRIQFFIIGAFCFLFLDKLDASVSVPLILTLIFITTIVGSTAGPPWFHFFSKTTPVKLRGRLLAVRLMLGSALGIIGGSVVTFILSAVAYPHNFALLFLVSFLFTIISFSFLKRIDEPAGETKVQSTDKNQKNKDNTRASLKEIIKQSKEILGRNKNFRNYLVADALILISLTAASFYAAYGINKFHLSTSYSGTFTIILMTSQVIGNIIFGYLGDYFGHKINILSLAVSSGLASLCAVLFDNVWLYGIVFVFTGFTLTLQIISRLAFVAEMCSESERPIYIALLNTVTAPTILFGILGGSLITIVGYAPVFLLYFFISLMGITWLSAYVIEPRKHIVVEK